MATTSKSSKSRELTPFQEKLNTIIFGWETPNGKLFDVVLLVIILISIGVVMLESVPSYAEKYERQLYIIEWVITIFFTVEYAARLYCAYQPKKYAKSFFGIVDFISILPSYIALFLTSVHFLTIVRSLRLLRAFKIFELSRYTSQGFLLIVALKKSIAKIIVFLVFILIFTSIIGAVMYVIEGDIPGTRFDSIPRSQWWAIVTLTTVGYGDIVPTTALGQFFSAVVMILGYSIIAVPTGIVSAEMMQAAHNKDDRPKRIRQCKYCLARGHVPKSAFCYRCGEEL